MFFGLEDKILDELHNDKYKDETYILAMKKFSEICSKLPQELQRELYEARHLYIKYFKNREKYIITSTLQYAINN